MWPYIKKRIITNPIREGEFNERRLEEALIELVEANFIEYDAQKNIVKVIDTDTLYYALSSSEGFREPTEHIKHWQQNTKRTFNLDLRKFKSLYDEFPCRAMRWLTEGTGTAYPLSRAMTAILQETVYSPLSLFTHLVNNVDNLTTKERVTLKLLISFRDNAIEQGWYGIGCPHNYILEFITVTSFEYDARFHKANEDGLLH